jgi:hypothetical protein
MSTIKVDTLQTRAGSTAAVTGAGFVATDQIRGNTAANSVTVVGEGGTVTTNLQQGLVKVWIQATSAGSISTQDSFNVASVADTSAGSLTPSITNDMANDDYSIAFGTSSSHVYHQALGTGSFQYTCANSGNTASDSANACATINGDLA